MINLDFKKYKIIFKNILKFLLTLKRTIRLKRQKLNNK